MRLTRVSNLVYLFLQPSHSISDPYSSHQQNYESRIPPITAPTTSTAPSTTASPTAGAASNAALPTLEAVSMAALPAPARRSPAPPTMSITTSPSTRSPKDHELSFFCSSSTSSSPTFVKSSDPSGSAIAHLHQILCGRGTRKYNSA